MADGKRVFILTLEAKTGADAVRAIRGVLKTALRRYGLKCISAREYRSGTVVVRDNFRVDLD